jgi:hypothetical protein
MMNFFFFNNKEEVFQYGYSIILKVLKYVLQSRSYMHVAARGAPFTRAHHLYTNVLFFFFVIIFLFVLSLFVILMINIDIHIPRVLSLTLVLLVRAKRV